MTTHHLDAKQVHHAWDNALPPRLVVEPGDTIVCETRDASDGYFHPGSTPEDVLARVSRGHPLTGPVRVEGARPGDVLAVTIVDMQPAEGWGWTMVRPGRGLLPEADTPRAHFQVWDVSDGRFARMRGRDIAVPLRPFPGVLGTALDEPGAHSTLPPRKNGGNMDVKQLVAGTTCYLPVWVDGALLSVGDGHGAQGDGEVCITAVEMAARVTLRLDLLRDRRLAEPQLRVPGRLPGAEDGPWYATTAHGPDLYAAAQQAVRYMIEHLMRERGLGREEAYVLASVCVDLRISEVVDAPHWIVSAFLPERVFG